MTNNLKKWWLTTHKYVKPSSHKAVKMTERDIMVYKGQALIKYLKHTDAKLMCNSGYYHLEGAKKLTHIWYQTVDKVTNYNNLFPASSSISDVTEPLIDNGDYESGQDMLFYLRVLTMQEIPSSRNEDKALRSEAHQIHKCCVGGAKIDDLDDLYVIPDSMSNAADVKQANSDDIRDIISDVIDLVDKDIKALKKL